MNRVPSLIAEAVTLSASANATAAIFSRGNVSRRIPRKLLNAASVSAFPPPVLGRQGLRLASNDNSDQSAADLWVSLPNVKATSRPADEDTASASTILSRLDLSRPIGHTLASNVAIELARSGAKVADVEHDPKFKAVLRSIDDTNVFSVGVKALTATHKALETMGMEAESAPMKSLENAVVWQMRAEALSDLTHVISYFHSRQDTAMRKKLFHELCSTVERRWYEVDDAATFGGFVQYWRSIHAQALAKMEDRMVEIVETMNASELASVIIFRRGTNMT